MKNVKIFLVSGKARHGKDTFYDLSKEMVNDVNHVKLSLATPLKAYAKTLGWDGEKDEKGRLLLQQLGDCLKAYHGMECFAVLLGKTIEKYIEMNSNYDTYIYVTDVRFKEEFYYLLDHFSGLENIELYTVRVERKGFESDLSDEAKSHRSEVDLDDIKDFNFNLINDSFDMYKNQIKLVHTYLKDRKTFLSTFLKAHE